LAEEETMRHVRRLLSDTVRVIRLELSLFRGRRKLALSTLGVMFVPSLYALMYLASVWDPYGKMQDLPVAIVNADRGCEYRGRTVDIGGEIVRTLEHEHKFRYEPFTDREPAKAAVRTGEMSFALLIPQDFSCNAIRGKRAAAGSLSVYVSEGNSYMAGIVGRRFATELAHTSSEALSAQRWTAVLDKMVSTQEQIPRLRSALGQLRDGAHQLENGLDRAHTGAESVSSGLERADQGARLLADGSARVATGTGTLSDGVQQLGAGIRTADTRLPADHDLAALATGADAVAQGSHDLDEGMRQLRAGSERLHAGAEQLRRGTARIPIFGGPASAGAGRLEDGIGQLQRGLTRASDGATQLHDGAARLDQGVGQLTGGVQRLHSGIHTMAERLPSDDQLRELALGSSKVAEGNATLASGAARLDTGAMQLKSGLSQLQEGSGRLAAGLDQLQDALPVEIDVLEGDAAGLAASIQPVTEAVASVPNNGTGFAPYFIPLSLWVGAVMTAFLFHFRHLPEPARSAPNAARMLGKLAVPLTIVLIQAAVIIAVVHDLLGVRLPHPFAFVATLLTASAVFLAIVMLLVHMFGDAGKVIAILLLILQLSSAGGPFPIELSGRFFQLVHPLLPFTYVMKALRANLFGAYDGHWFVFYARLLLSGALTAIATLAIGRWKFVPEDRYAPAFDS
jgi:putative membrane protein